MKRLSRREFLASASSIAAAAPALAAAAAAAGAQGFQGTLCLFSKPFPQLNWRDLAQGARKAGFDGIDLTVRRRGHVLPERAAVDLPRAVGEIRDAGLQVPMITTDLLSADDPTAEPILSTAAKLSIPYLKPDYYPYRRLSIQEALEEAKQKFHGLAALAQKHGVQLGYHNHPRYVGAPVWDFARVLEPLDPRWSGYYYDLGHATGDGGESCWHISTDLVMPRLKMIGARDVVWVQTGPHQWQLRDCPIGQGMAHWREFLRTLAQSNFRGPISLHEEFARPGLSNRDGIALSREQCPELMAQIAEDLSRLKSLVKEAYPRVS